MPDADFWHPAASRSICAWRTWPQITHQAETTNSKTEEGIFQGDERGDSEKAQSRDRTIAHASANSRRHVSAGFDKFPNQQGIGHVHKEEDRRVEGNRLGRKPAYRHPSRREREQRDGKEMSEIEPHQARCGFRGVAQQIVMIGPDDSDEQVTNRIT